MVILKCTYIYMYRHIFTRVDTHIFIYIHLYIPIIAYKCVKSMCVDGGVVDEDDEFYDDV